MRAWMKELTTGAAAGKDFTSTDLTGAPAVLPDWFQFVNDGTLVFVDEDGNTETINGKAGQSFSCTIKKITTSSDTIRVGKLPPGGTLPPQIGAPGAVGGTWTVTGPLTSTSNNLAADQFAKCDTTGAVTVTLPTAVGISGHRIAVKDITDASVHNITVARTSAQTIDGAASNKTISTAKQCVIFVSDGANWFVEGAA
jgi:hypothetical protein